MTLETVVLIVSLVSTVVGLVAGIWGKVVAARAKGETVKVEEVLKIVVTGVDDVKKVLGKRSAKLPTKAIAARAEEAGLSRTLDDFLQKVGANK